MLELFLPKRCIHCNEPSVRTEEALSKYLCPNCLREFHLLEPPENEELEERRHLLGRIPCPVGIYAAYHFVTDGLMQSIVHHMKYADMPRLARRMGAEASVPFAQLAEFIDVIVPVPLHVTRYAERGYNQAEVLAKGLSKAFAKMLLPSAVKRIKPTPSQTHMTVKEREENVRGAFKLTPRATKELKGKRVLIVDDVITTGATMASVGLEIAKAQPKEVGFFSLAAAQL